MRYLSKTPANPGVFGVLGASSPGARSDREILRGDHPVGAFLATT
jgi:hypothetical protein